MGEISNAFDYSPISNTHSRFVNIKPTTVGHPGNPYVVPWTLYMPIKGITDRIDNKGTREADRVR